MRNRFLMPCLLLMFLGSVTRAADRQPYYLALGDSLSIGIQPNASGADVTTNQGYVDDLYSFLRTFRPNLQLAKFGCSGETSVSMDIGGVCSYAEGSQLAEAVAFIRTHDVTLITLDIGANDIDACISSTTGVIDASCESTAVGNVTSYLPRILYALRTAAPRIPIVAMNYYDPALAAWTLAANNGPTLAELSEQATVSFNDLLAELYQEAGVPVADVAEAFHISNFTEIPGINLPINVFLTLTWTWMAAPTPVGPNVHPNAAGYAVIATAFATKIRL